MAEIDVREAIRQMKDDALMIAAILCYNQARVGKGGCEECCLRLGDAIRDLMRPQR